MRTTDAAVKLITDVDTTIDTSPFIEIANALVTEVCYPLGYDDTRLELIERWLSAHFYRVRDPSKSSEGVGPVSESNIYQVGLGFNQTREGQQALLLDTLGGLATLQQTTQDPTKRSTRQMVWLGTEAE